MTRLRTVAILMLLAGLTLGIFATRALRAMGSEADDGLQGRGNERIELYVEMLRADYHLSDDQENRVRQVLLRYDQQVRAKLWQLRQEHAAEFRTLSDEAKAETEAILAEAVSGR